MTGYQKSKKGVSESMSEMPTKKELATLLDSVAHQTIYDAGRSGKFTRKQLRVVSKRDKLNGGLVAASAQAVVPKTLLDHILPTFRNLLGSFIDNESDRIGNGLFNLAGGIPEPSLSDFVEILIRASAVIGGERAAGLLIGWIQGEPVKYQAISLLNGVTIDQPLILQEGLRLYKLPQSSNELAAHLPAMSLAMHGVHAMLGRVALAIECEAGPALYLPSKEESVSNNLKQTCASGRLDNLSVDSFCEAMSLACGGCVRWQFSWRDFGDVREFLHVQGGTSFSNVPLWTNASGFTQEYFEHARKIHNLRNARGKDKPSLDTAVRRWIKSKSSESSFSDQLIDLRVALEALYLDNYEGELRFRLASHGAWHISKDTDERKESFQILLQIYKLASSAVHGSDVKTNDKNKTLLENAQSLCQKGIMRRLREKEYPKWNDVIMGDNI